jgi:hypothetical protein
MSGEFVSVADCESSVEAHVIRLRLEGEGIQAHVDDEFACTTGLVHLWNAARPHVKVLVRARDAARAEQVLEEVSSGPRARPESADCPECGSKSIARDKRVIAYFVFVLAAIFSLHTLYVWGHPILHLAAFFMALAALIYWALRRRTMKCKECGAFWIPPAK